MAAIEITSVELHAHQRFRIAAKAAPTEATT